VFIPAGESKWLLQRTAIQEAQSLPVGLNKLRGIENEETRSGYSDHFVKNSARDKKDEDGGQ
jgi:hypothetical protein